MKIAMHSAICWLSVFTEALQLNLWLEIQFLYFCTLCKQERSFFPLSAALLSSPILHLASGPAAEILMGIASSIESIILSLLFSRSGLSFLLSQPEATELIVLSLQDVENVNKAECITLRQAFVLLSKGFFCRPQEVGIITELHLKVVCAVASHLFNL